MASELTRAKRRVTLEEGPGSDPGFSARHAENDKRAAAYAQVYELTHAACLGCPNEAAKRQYRCCDPRGCENARKWAMRKGVTLQATGHPTLPFMGPAGCVVAIELRPLCTMHHCSACGGDTRYFELRDRIEALEGEDWQRYLASL